MYIKTCENFLVNIDYISSFEHQELSQKTLFEVYAKMTNNEEILLRTFSKEEYANDFIKVLFSKMSLQLSITSNIAPVNPYLKLLMFMTFMMKRTRKYSPLLKIRRNVDA